MPQVIPASVDALTNTELDVLAIGSALVDVLAHAEESLIESLGLARGAMALVDRSQSQAIYSKMPAGTEVSGGSAANTAVGVACLGGRAGYLGKVAGDELGKVFRHDIEASGVVLGGALATAPDGSGAGLVDAELGATGNCLVLVTPDGQRTMATHLGVASSFGPGDLDDELIGRTKVLYLEGYLWDLPPAKDAMRRAIELAHASDALVALSVSDPFCVERHRREFVELLHDQVDVLFANEEEATALFGSADLDGAVSSLEETGLLAAVTRGADGSVVVGPQGPVAVPAEPVAAVVDTTGAGDLYAAGFLYGLTHGREPELCARLGGLCAAEVIGHLGARPLADLAEQARTAGLA